MEELSQGTELMGLEARRVSREHGQALTAVQPCRGVEMRGQGSKATEQPGGMHPAKGAWQRRPRLGPEEAATIPCVELRRAIQSKVFTRICGAR